MAEADDKVITPTLLAWHEPKVWQEHSAAATFAGAGELQADPSRAVTILIDGPSPPSADEWLQDAAERLKNAADRPVQITDAARRLADDMHEAFLRRQVVRELGAGHIKNLLLDWGYWPRTRPPAP
jgi:hypothetical protein